MAYSFWIYLGDPKAAYKTCYIFENCALVCFFHNNSFG